MNLHLVWAALLGAVLGSLADWLFAGIIFHDRYHLTPETWRAGEQGRRIAAAQALTLVSSAAFVALAWKVHQTDLRGALKLAAMVWLIGPLPMLLANAMFIRIDHRVTASHAAGWLVKLLLIGGVVAWLL
jgi:intracellular septation protein A